MIRTLVVDTFGAGAVPALPQTPAAPKFARQTANDCTTCHSLPPNPNRSGDSISAASFELEGPPKGVFLDPFYRKRRSAVGVITGGNPS